MVLFGLAAAVTLVHLLLADKALEDALGSGEQNGAPRRIEVSFVRELARSAEPLATPVAPALPRVNAAAAALPASSPALAELPPLPVPLPTPSVASVPEPAPPIAEAVIAQAPEPLPAPSPPTVAEPPPAPPITPAFEWPPSTRLTYTLTGNYRGPVDGQARVEWLRSGTRYQMHLDVNIGPSIAPLMSRRMSSDGELTPQGLRPLRYDEETKVVLRSPRQQSITFDDERIRLPAGTELPRPAGVQDAASQFGQLTWLFTTQPALLEPGRSIEIPLALPRRVDLWTYDVLERETLNTPAGPIEAVHVKPRREARSGDLTAEMWIAPTLQYLPVRIVIRQDEQTWVDLLLQRLPQQAMPPAGR